MPQRTNFRNRPPQEVRVVVFGATGYIGRFVVKELVERGYQVIAFARKNSGVGVSRAANRSLQIFPSNGSVWGCHRSGIDRQRGLYRTSGCGCVVSCLTDGGRKDSWAIDYQATLNTYQEGKRAGASHYVLLSAICVQKPLLEFQKAKLAFEAELIADQEMTHSIVRPTAFFKSLGGQVESCRKGGPYVMFGGELASCKPISEADLASFMADCISDESKTTRSCPSEAPAQP